MLKQHTICYIEETCQPKDFHQCSNCYFNKHTCKLTYEQFEQKIKLNNFNYDYVRIIRNLCNCNQCKKNERCENFKKLAVEKLKELEKINCKVCRSENKLDPPLNTSCKCVNKKELYFYKISRYDEIDMYKNECYIIDVYKYEDFLQEREKLNYAHEISTIVYANLALEKNASKICSFTIHDTLDDSDTVLNELLEKYKTMFNCKILIIVQFLFSEI